MRNYGFVTIALAGVAVALTVAAVDSPANATVTPNGKFSYSVPATNTVDTGDIASTTTSLTLGNGFPGAMITSLVDPYLGAPNNFCIGPGAGCTAMHPPGFLGVGSGVLFSTLTLPVGNTSPVPVAETITAQTDFGLGGVVDVDFDFTDIVTSALTPTTSTSVGSLTLDFTGTFASNNTNEYTLGEAAIGSITCTQDSVGAAITCNGTVATPVSAPAVPEPGSLALLGSAMFAFRAFRRRSRA
jgi:hypothetical protein